MNARPNVLVTSAAGRTGAVATVELLHRLGNRGFAHESPRWVAAAERRELYLLPPSDSTDSISSRMLEPTPRPR